MTEDQLPISDQNGGASEAASDERGRIDVHVRDLSQFFHSLDPSPFHDRSLDSEAEEFIVSSAKELPPEVHPTLVLYLAQQGDTPDQSRIVAAAVHVHFTRRAARSQRELRELFRRGRTSLAIGLLFLAFSIAGGELIVQTMAVRPLSAVLRESLLIGGWVAMWRPMEIFLYDWWPIHDERRLFERLARMKVKVLKGPPLPNG